MNLNIRSCHVAIAAISLCLFAIAPSPVAEAASGELGAYGAEDYARSGLVVQFDGLENAGPRQHDSALAVWKNLVGDETGATDITLPSWVEVEDNALYSKVVPGLSGADAINKSKSNCPQLDPALIPGITDRTPAVTLEVVMALDKWDYTDNYWNIQTVFDTPCGHIGYRSDVDAGEVANGFSLTYPVSSEKMNLYNWRPNAKVKDVHTLSATLGIGVNALWLDGVKDGSTIYNSYESGRKSNYTFFSNLRAGIRVYAIRLYDHVLTADERLANSVLDRARFLGIEPTKAETNALKMVVGAIPVQRLDGLTDAQPSPEVRNVIGKKTLVRGRDYFVSYANNVRPGTGTLTVTGLGDYAGLSFTRTFTIVEGFTARVTDGLDGSLRATVEFPSVNVDRDLWAAYGATDAGPRTNGWETVVRVGSVPAGATSATCTLDARSADAGAVRFFLDTPVDHRAYVTEGLCGLWDAVSNAGTLDRPVHDGSSRTWVDMSGCGNDIGLPNFVTVQENALYSDVVGTTTKSDLPIYTQFNGMPASPTKLTEEEVMKRGNWRYTDNYASMQGVFATPLGQAAYRGQDTDSGFGVSFPQKNSSGKWGTQYYNWKSDAKAKAGDVHTIGARLGQGSANVSFAIDGTIDSTVISDGLGSYFSNSAPAARYTFFSNTRAPVTIHGLRLYSRQLTDSELARNAAVDAVRFRGGNGRMLAASSCAICGRLESEPCTDGISVKMGVSDRVRDLYAMWGPADAGEGMDDWPNVAHVATVPAGVSELAFVALPQSAKRALAGRLVLTVRYDSTCYVTNGLLLQYDGVENSLVNGVRTHLDNPTTWADLTGRGADVTLPSDRVTVEAMGLYVKSHQGKLTPAVPVSVAGLDSSSDVITLEIVARHCGFENGGDESALQPLFATPLGTLGYRLSDSRTFYYQMPIAGGKTDLCEWKHATAERKDIHTVAATFAQGATTIWMDGVGDTLKGSAGYQSSRPASCSVFGNKFVGERLYSIRLYGRRLTAAEFAENAEIDAIRFLGRESVSPRCSGPLDFRNHLGMCIILR